MTSLFTQEELVQFLYNETSPEKSAAIEAALQNDWSLQEEFEVLRTSSDSLSSRLESPRTATILAVMKHAREALEESFQDH